MLAAAEMAVEVGTIYAAYRESMDTVLDIYNNCIDDECDD